MRPGIYNPSEFSLEEVNKLATMNIDLMLLEDDNFIIAGHVCVVDWMGFSMSHMHPIVSQENNCVVSRCLSK